VDDGDAVIEDIDTDIDTDDEDISYKGVLTKSIRKRDTEAANAKTNPKKAKNNPTSQKRTRSGAAK
jgi:hypothetical protein